MKYEEFGIATLICLVGAVFIYSVYYLGKTISYKLIYEDMVQDTIQLQVKESCLNDTTR
jgi:hypothetical protein